MCLLVNANCPRDVEAFWPDALVDRNLYRLRLNSSEFRENNDAQPDLRARTSAQDAELPTWACNWTSGLGFDAI